MFNRRLIDCVRLIAQVTTNKVVAAEFALSSEIVLEYVEEPRQRYGSKRMAS